MVTIEKFKKVTENLTNDYLIKMSCHTKEYTLNNPHCANNGTVYFDGYGLGFAIDWNNSKSYTLGEFRRLLEQDLDLMVGEITSTDIDDGNALTFEDVIINDGEIILV